MDSWTPGPGGKEKSHPDPPPPEQGAPGPASASHGRSPRRRAATQGTRDMVVFRGGLGTKVDSSGLNSKTQMLCSCWKVHDASKTKVPQKEFKHELQKSQGQEWPASSRGDICIPMSNVLNKMSQICENSGSSHSGSGFKVFRCDSISCFGCISHTAVWPQIEIKPVQGNLY